MRMTGAGLVAFASSGPSKIPGYQDDSPYLLKQEFSPPPSLNISDMQRT